MKDKTTSDDLHKEKEMFGHYMLAQLEAKNEHIEKFAERIDLTIQLYATIASAAVGLFILVLTANQPVHVILGTLSLIMMAVGTVGAVFFLRIVTLRTSSEEEEARRNFIHRYFGSLDPESFRYYRGWYSIVYFQTLSWRRSYKDRVFLVSFGMANAIILALGIPILVSAAVLGVTGYPFAMNVWWIVISGLLLSLLLCTLTFFEYRRRFSRSDLTIQSIGNIKRLEIDPVADDLASKNLAGADLMGFNLKGADLRKASLVNADLSYADMSMANLEEADLREARLAGARFINANLTAIKLAGAIADSATVWPKGFDPEKAGIVLKD
jgi:hypothetical protein